MQGKNKKRKEKRKRKVGSKAQKQARKSYSRRLHSNKSSCLCYKAENLATLSAIFLLSSATVSSVTAAAVEPPHPANKSTKTQTNCLDSGAVATQVPLISRTGTLPHDLPFHFSIRRQQYQYGCPSLSLSPFPCHHSWRPL